ncbi:hypothetical protein FRB94_004062 [Tulasnella sp. JGI-2019a]|nr:hypothetical protein FRB94_004062 [Tulasnella sp. JGI-2019a]
MHSDRVVRLLAQAELLMPSETKPGLLVSKIRVSDLYPYLKGKGRNFYVHSPWPTADVDSVFFGPDSYRYLRYMAPLTHRISNCKVAIDMCTGAGVGAIHLAKASPTAKVWGLDINPKALAFARINAEHACPDIAPGRLQMLYSDAYTTVRSELKGTVDVIAIDPPFIADDARTYAQGGYLGIEFTIGMFKKSQEMLRDGGETWVHMAAPIAFDGRDIFREEIEKLEGWEIADYEIIDVDIFGNEMENTKTYSGIGHLASIGLVFKKVGN